MKTIKFYYKNYSKLIFSEDKEVLFLLYILILIPGLILIISGLILSTPFAMATGILCNGLNCLGVIILIFRKYRKAVIKPSLLRNYIILTRCAICKLCAFLLFSVIKSYAYPPYPGIEENKLLMIVMGIMFIFTTLHFYYTVRASYHFYKLVRTRGFSI